MGIYFKCKSHGCLLRISSHRISTSSPEVSFGYGLGEGRAHDHLDLVPQRGGRVETAPTSAAVAGGHQADARTEAVGAAKVSAR